MSICFCLFQYVIVEDDCDVDEDDDEEPEEEEEKETIPCKLDKSKRTWIPPTIAPPLPLFKFSKDSSIAPPKTLHGNVCPTIEHVETQESEGEPLHNPVRSRYVII